MEDKSNKLTFSQIYQVAKLTLKRGLIYVLVSVVIMGAILLGVRAFTAYTSSVSKIILHTPPYNVVEKLNENKEEAINKVLMTFKDGKHTDDAQTILKNLSIEAQIPRGEDEDTYIPKNYELTLRNVDTVKCTLEEFNSLLTLITKELLSMSPLSEMANRTYNAAQTSYDNFISTIAIVMVLVATVFIAYGVAYAQTYTRLKKNGYFKKKTPVEEQPVNDQNTENSLQQEAQEEQ